MNSNELKARTKQFALRTIRLVAELPNNKIGNIIANQLLRSSTSVGANYRSACKARSKADFISKITIVEEEADECIYWFELIVESGMMTNNQVDALINEARELTAIFTAAGKTAKHSNSKSTIRNPKS